MFDDDFHHHKYGGICEDINHNAMKKFEFPNEFLPDESFALRSCEKYCSRKDACWGCSLFCDGLRCQWNAVSECKRQTTLDDDDKVYTSQKPSRSCMNIVNTIDLSTHNADQSFCFSAALSFLHQFVRMSQSNLSMREIQWSGS